jgi:antitoxin CptB
MVLARLQSEISMDGGSITDGDTRRRRLLFRSQHRGTREMDLLMGRFAEAAVGQLSDAELEAFEQLIELPDSDVLDWFTGRQPTPAIYDTRLFRKLKAFHSHPRPLHR